MKKEEILELSRKENKNKDLAEIQIENKAIKYGTLSILILTTIYFIMEIVIQGNTNYGWYSIIALYCGVAFGYKAIKTKKKLSIFNAIIWLLCSIILISSYIKTIFAGAI